MILLSCSKEEVRGFNYVEAEAPIFPQSAMLEGDINLMVAFYWPSIILPAEEDKVVDIIKRSRALNKSKAEFLENKKTNQCQFESLSCECVLDEECEAEEGRYRQCARLEEDLTDLEIEIFETISSQSEKIKNSLQEFSTPGEWIEVLLYSEDDTLASIDTVREQLIVPGWGEGPLGVYRMSYAAPFLSFQFNKSGRVNQAKLSVKEFAHSTQVSGELTETLNGELSRKGVLFFEIAKEFGCQAL